jgi:hypothetical protein
VCLFVRMYTRDLAVRVFVCEAEKNLLFNSLLSMRVLPCALYPTFISSKRKRVHASRIEAMPQHPPTHSPTHPLTR